MARGKIWALPGAVARHLRQTLCYRIADDSGDRAIDVPGFRMDRHEECGDPWRNWGK